MIAPEMLEIQGSELCGWPRRLERRADPGRSKRSLLEVREGRLGQGVYAVRRLRKGESVLRGWGDPVPQRIQHSIQVDSDLHILPHAPLQLLNHSCEPSCGLLVRR